MEVNNFKLIESLLDFTSSDDFYFLQILKRKKENPEVPSNHNNNKRAIRTYYINSLDHYRGIEDEVKSICLATNSRAYIHLTKRSYKRVGKLCASIIMDRICNNQENHIYKAYNTACGSPESVSDNKYWLIDIDSKNITFLTQYNSIINRVWESHNKIEGDTWYIATIPTLNGYHLITKPFRVDTFLQECAMYKLENPDIQKNNPTLLYYSDGK